MTVKRKKGAFIVLILLIVLVVSLASVIIWNSTPLTRRKIMILKAVRGDRLTWSDFRFFPHEEMGSGMCIWEYPLKDGGSMLISGTSSDEIPWSIWILLPSGEEIWIKH